MHYLQHFGINCLRQVSSILIKIKAFKDLQQDITFPSTCTKLKIKASVFKHYAIIVPISLAN